MCSDRRIIRLPTSLYWLVAKLAKEIRTDHLSLPKASAFKSINFSFSANEVNTFVIVHDFVK